MDSRCAGCFARDKRLAPSRSRSIPGLGKDFVEATGRRYAPAEGSHSCWRVAAANAKIKKRQIHFRADYHQKPSSKRPTALGPNPIARPPLNPSLPSHWRRCLPSCRHQLYCISRRSYPLTSSRILPIPNFQTWSTLIWGIDGISVGSTTTSTMTGPGVDRACATVSRNPCGCVMRRP
jgi:hypothetical protein